MKILRRKTATKKASPAMQQGSLSEFDQFVLLALVHLRDEGYGRTIWDEIKERTGRSVSLGAIYATLERMEERGYVTSRRGEATAVRGGRAKRYFKITASGVQVLNEAREASRRMWVGVSMVVRP